MRQFVRIGSTALGIALAGLTAWSTFGAVGCVITTEDDTDGGVTDTGTTGDTANPGTTGGLSIKASDLLASQASDTDIKDFGGGSTYAEITGLKIAYAKAKIVSGPTIPADPEFPSGLSVIGKGASGYLDGTIEGLLPGEYQILVTGYLRGVNGPGVEDGNTDVNLRVPFARAKCSATVTVGAVAPATCEILSIIDPDTSDLVSKGIIFPSDLLPAGYCAGAGATKFELLRARFPTIGSALVSTAGSDCQGVIFIPEATSWTSMESGTTRETVWSLSLEPKFNTTPHCPDPAGSDPNNCTACTITTQCKVIRKDASGNIDLFVVNPATNPGCVVSAANTGTTDCF